MNIFLVSLGCDKNLVDSENMLGLISAAGYTIINDESQADIIIINTCCFIHDAKEESINAILEMAEYKKAGRLKALIVTGCLAQRYKDEIKNELPEVDGLLRFTDEYNIIDIIASTLGEKEHQKVNSGNSKRILTTGGHYGYLKVSEGCSKNCTYCAIPMIRGPYKSADMEDLISEAEYLAQEGVKELILVAQETTIYGVDLYGKKMLPILLKRLCEIDGIQWIRILYCYPEEITDELIQVIKEEDKICKYLDLPIQHSNDDVLKLMGRKASRADITNIVNKLRSEIPEIVIRTTLITGFPTETLEQHEDVLEFVNEMKFERLGVFTYSEEEDTPAVKLNPKVTDEEKEIRRDNIMKLQQEIVFLRNKTLIGNVYEILIEGKIVDEDNVYMGRTYMDMPDVDGYIFIDSDRELMTGDLVKAKVTAAKEYDLIGEIIKDEV